MRTARWFVIGPVAVFGVFWLIAALATVRVPSQDVDDSCWKFTISASANRAVRC